MDYGVEIIPNNEQQGDSGHCYFCCFCNVDGYGPEDIEIKWKEGPKPVKAYSDVQMAQFKLMGITFGNATTGKNHGNLFSGLTNTHSDTY